MIDIETFILKQITFAQIKLFTHFDLNANERTFINFSDVSNFRANKTIDQLPFIDCYGNT